MNKLTIKLPFIVHCYDYHEFEVISNWLKLLTDKSVKHVQSYATTCRKKGLLPKAEKGKNSPVRKPTKRKER